jgi:RND family efflux transporter MFP subunit
MRKPMTTAIALGALAVLAAAYWAVVIRETRPAASPMAAGGAPPVTVARPVVREIVEQDEFTGRFEAVRAVEIRARVGGFLESVHFRDGAIVREGDLLFVIDRRPFQASLAQAEANLAAARTRLDLARVELDRAERLRTTGVAPERQLDERRQQMQSAQAEVAGLRAAADRARLDHEFTEIRAPIAGRIGRRLVTEGNLVGANETLLTTIMSLDPIHFYFDVDERSYLAYARMARDGTRQSGRETAHEVRVALADEREFRHRGLMDFVDNRMDPGSGTMRGRALIDNPEQLLVPGLFGRIVISGSLPYRAVLLPDEAIGADQDRRFVYVVAADGSVSARNIRPGPRHDGYRIVRQGLEGTETVVVAGIQRVRPGARVTPQAINLPQTR